MHALTDVVMLQEKKNSVLSVLVVSVSTKLISSFKLMSLNWPVQSFTTVLTWLAKCKCHIKM